LKITAITWDANFRENLHTIDCFAGQNLSPHEYELVWVDFYRSNERVREKVQYYQSQGRNIKLLCLNNSDDKKWHIGEMINKGAEIAQGDNLIITDGDLFIPDDFLSKVIAEAGGFENQAMYFRRYDEHYSKYQMRKELSISTLEETTRLVNPLNYATAVALPKILFNAVSGFDVHPIFAGSGMIAKDFAHRIRNYGAALRWSQIKVYHPWHQGSGKPSYNFQSRNIAICNSFLSLDTTILRS
jgi:hypothetical protein